MWLIQTKFNILGQRVNEMSAERLHRGVVPLRHVPPPRQYGDYSIVYRTELTVSLCDSGGIIETGKKVLVDTVHSDRNGPFSVIEFSTNESLYVISY